jgi:hypothetical protein
MHTEVSGCPLEIRWVRLGTFGLWGLLWSLDTLTRQGKFGAWDKLAHPVFNLSSTAIKFPHPHPTPSN